MSLNESALRQESGSDASAVRPVTSPFTGIDLRIWARFPLAELRDLSQAPKARHLGHPFFVGELSSPGTWAMHRKGNRVNAAPR